jgi:hypothetical protein
MHDREALAHLRGAHVVQHVGAHDEIVRPLEAHRAQIAHRAQTDVARATESLHGVHARVHAVVGDARTQTAQLGAPRRLAAAHVEHARDRSAEQVLRRGHRESHLARDEVIGPTPTAERRYQCSKYASS